MSTSIYPTGLSCRYKGVLKVYRWIDVRRHDLEGLVSGGLGKWRAWSVERGCKIV